MKTGRGWGPRVRFNLQMLGAGLLFATACESTDDLSSRGPRGQGYDGRGTSADDVSGANAGPKPPQGNGLPCDVNAVLTAKCHLCHGASPAFGASAPLVTRADLDKTWLAGKKLHEIASTRVHDDARPMPPAPNPRLSAKEIEVLDAWSKAGAPGSNDRCQSAPPPPSKKPLSCKPDAVLKAARPFTMKAGAPLDQYVCFGVDVTLPKKRHVVAMAPHVDNTKILHHVLVFQSTEPYGAEPTECAAFGSASWKLVTGWAPGGENFELPPEAGFPEEKGTTHWVVQLHYNNAANVPGATDNSGYELCTTEQLRPNDAGVLAFGSASFQVPPRTTHNITCDYALDERFRGVKLFSALSHMHKLGTSMSTYRISPGAAAAKVLDTQAFDFENQAAVPINVSVQPGDVVQTKCGWKNTTDATVKFGEGTGDEMCFDFVSYYPAIPDITLFGLPVFTWITPSLFAQCTVGP